MMTFFTKIFKPKTPETLGVALVLVVAVFWGMFPIVVNKGSQHIPPLFFAAVSTFIGALVAAFVSFIKKDFKKIFNKKGLGWGIGVAFTMSAFHYGLLFVGSTMTSGVNTAALELSEILFTILITPFFGEKPTVYKTLGGVFVLTGAFVILFKGGNFSVGDVLIIASTSLLPFGNLFGKKALQYFNSENLLVVRYFFGGLMLLMMSFIFEDRTAMIPSLVNYWPYVALNGVLLLGLVNILWYEGLKRLQISKAVFLLMTFPIFSLLFLTVFYNEQPNFFQVIGVLIIVLGAYFTAKPDRSLKEDVVWDGTIKKL
jgi:drug/metabolite transporter (DMT)-like permease